MSLCTSSLVGGVLAEALWPLVSGERSAVPRRAGPAAGQLAPCPKCRRPVPFTSFGRCAVCGEVVAAVAPPSEAKLLAATLGQQVLEVVPLVIGLLLLGLGAWLVHLARGIGLVQIGLIGFGGALTIRWIKRRVAQP